MLVVSLLISVVVPHLQKRGHNLSPLVFFVILAVVALGVIMHTSMDQTLEPLVGISASSYVILADGGVAQASGAADGESYSAGTYVLFIIIAVVAAVYAFRMLFKHLSAPMVAFMIVVAIASLGLIFNPDSPDTPGDATTEQAAPAGMDGFAPAFFALETVEESGGVGEVVAFTAYTIVALSGVVLLSSLIILVMLPHVTPRTKQIAMFLFAAAVAMVAIGALFFSDVDQGYLVGSLAGEIYAVALVGVGLFIITAPLVHTRFNNISNVFIATMGVLALVCVYFFTAPEEVEQTDKVAVYAQSVFKTSPAPAALSNFEYSEPARVNVGEEGMSVYAQLAYCAFMIVLLHVFLYIAMGELSFRSFWRYWHIAMFSVLAWGLLFYAAGVPLWQIIAVIGVAMITAPNIMHIISTYQIKQGRDAAISQWSG